jgi:hypothetical protein
MEQFKASDENWQSVVDTSHDFKACYARTIRELRDRVAALEAAPASPAAAVLSDQELREIWKSTQGGAIEHFRALVDRGYQQGLEAGRAEQGSSQGILDDSTPEPDAPQTLHSVALGHVDGLRRLGVIPQICDTLRRAIREPMADLTPEPNQAPAAEAGLVEEVLDAMGEGTEVEARAAIRAVARWLRSVGNCGSAADLEREANR